MRQLVFVYGTLKSGGYNNRVMGGSKSLGPATTIEDTFTMFDGGFPYVIPEGSFHVRGEVFEVDSEDVLRGLDRLEGVPDHFIRRNVDVKTDDDNVLSGFMYVAAPSTQKYLSIGGRRSTVQPNDNNVCEWGK